MNEKIKAKAQSLYPIESHANEHTAFLQGAKKADKTRVEKACEWIKNNKHLYKELSFGSLSTDWDKFIVEFRKAMEE